MISKNRFNATRALDLRGKLTHLRGETIADESTEQVNGDFLVSSPFAIGPNKGKSYVEPKRSLTF
jgi:hypothetical protein